MATQTTSKCFVCGEGVGTFRCPKCRIRYCKLECYKNHGTACTEKFHEESFEQSGVGNERANEDVKREMEMILMREKEAWDEENPEEDERRGVLEAVERELEGRVLDEDEVMKMVDTLPVDMREEFLRQVKEAPEKVVASGNGTENPPWWAEGSDELPPQQPVDINVNIIKPAHPPSLCLANHIVEIICGYTAVCQVYEYRTTWSGDAMGAVELLFELTSSLTPVKEYLYTTPVDALEAVSNKAVLLPSYKSNDRMLLSAVFLKDALPLLSVENCTRALNHLKETLLEAKGSLPVGKRSRGVQGKSLLSAAAKKLDFFMAFVVVVMGAPAFAEITKQLEDSMTGHREALAADDKPEDGGKWKHIIKS